MSDSDSDKGSGSGSDEDRDSGSDDGSNDSGSGSGSGSDSSKGSNSDSDSSKSSGSDDSSNSGKKKKKDKKKGKQNEIEKPKLSLFFELQNVMKSILLDMNTVDKNVKQIEMRFNPPKPLPKPTPPRRPLSQKSSPTRNYNPPGGYNSNQQPAVQFQGQEVSGRGILKQGYQQHQPQYTSEYGGSQSHVSQMSHGRTSSAHQNSQDNLSYLTGPGPMVNNMEPALPYQIMPQSFPQRFGQSGPYTKYLKAGTSNPEPTYTNRFFQHSHQVQAQAPMPSRFSNPVAAQTQPSGRSYINAHNQQQQQFQSQQSASSRPQNSMRPPVQHQQPFQQATTMLDHTLVPQATQDMMRAQDQFQQDQQYPKKQHLTYHRNRSNTIQYQQQNYQDIESEETTRMYQNGNQDYGQKLASKGPPSTIGTAVDRIHLTQIEDAIDRLLSQ